MTPICSEHAALLKRIARHPEDRHCRKVYADWLQERGDPAWYVVANYEVAEWVKYRPVGYWRKSDGVGQVPWLGEPLPVGGPSPKARAKRLLLAYAEGKAK